MEFYNARVINKQMLTSESAAIDFELEDGVEVTALSGQYITILNPHNELRRCYSISKPQRGQIVQIAVKKVKGGKVSPYLVDDLQVGDTTKISLAEGRFTVASDAESNRKHYFIAAGSGITPIMAMTKTLLREEPLSNIHLLYSNRSKKTSMFYEELLAMAEKHAGQFFLDLTFTRSKLPNWRILSRDWNTHKRRIDQKLLDKWLSGYPLEEKESHFYICGPEKLINTCEQYLLEKNIPTDHIHKEYFTVEDSGTEEKIPATKSFEGMAKVRVQLDGETISLELDRNQTILEAVEEAGYFPPYSCREGICSSCIAKVSQGTLSMDQCHALDDKEIEKGYVLTCQSRVSSDEIELKYI